MKRKSLISLLILMILITISFNAFAEENDGLIEPDLSALETVNEQKIKYAPSPADFLIKSIDEQTKEELVRTILSKEDEELIAKMLWGEDRENPIYQRAAVIWCVFNRMDAWGQRIEQIINSTQFTGYRKSNPVQEWAVELVRDVTIRYALEKSGYDNVGRTLPKRFLYFENVPPRRDNYFKVKKSILDPTNEIWNWKLPSPYEADK